MKAVVDNKEVKVGDYVGFKSDIEQSGEIKAIKRDAMGQIVLVLVNEDGFQGGYIGGDTSTTVRASDCWLD